MARLSLRAPAALSRFIAPKGSVALDGVSLTVNEVEGDTFSVLIIPHTLQVTTFGSLQRRRAAQSRSRPDGALCRAAAGGRDAAVQRPRLHSALLVRRGFALATDRRSDSGVMQWPGRGEANAKRRRQRCAHPHRRGALLRRHCRCAAGRRDESAQGGRRRGRAHQRAGLARNPRRHRDRARRRAKRKRRPYDGVVALGCVIRGDTIHFEIVSQQSAQGLMELSVARALPIGNGIITVNTEAQAWPAPASKSRTRAATPPRAALALVGSSASCAGEMSMARAAASEARKANKRGAARLAAVQALYQMDLAGTGLERDHGRVREPLARRRGRGRAISAGGSGFFRDIVGGVVREQGRLDPQIDAALARGWPLKRIEAVLRAVLRAGAYELACRRDVPARVVMSEYVDVASAFVDRGRDRHGQCRARPAGARRLRAGEFD